MQVYKSFLHKKTTKIYVFLFSILLLGIFLIHEIASLNLSLTNKKYEGSSIRIIANKEKKEQIQNIKNILNIEESNTLIYLKDSFFSYVTLKASDELKNDEIILPKDYDEDKQIINILNKDYKIIKYEKNLSNNIFLVSKETLIDISSKTEVGEYEITLKNWLKEKRTIKEIEKIVNSTNHHRIEKNLNKVDNNVVFLTNVIQIAANFIIGIFFCCYIVCLINLFIDEDSINQLLRYIGYKDKKIWLMNHYKFLILFILNIVISLIIYFLSHFVLKIFYTNTRIDQIYIIEIIGLCFLFSILVNLVIYKRRRKKL